MIPRTNQEASQSEACQTPRPVRRPEATGLRNPQASYYRARYYDQNAGRFLSEDPLGFNAKRFNFYSYVLNNPLRFADPLGLCPPQLDSITRYHLDCQRIPTQKDRCACHAVYVPDDSWQDFMDKCTVCGKKDAKPRDVCLCQCNLVKKIMPDRFNSLISRAKLTVRCKIHENIYRVRYGTTCQLAAMVFHSFLLRRWFRLRSRKLYDG
jgi:RHS repeat-associated protein